MLDGLEAATTVEGGQRGLAVKVVLILHHQTCAGDWGGRGERERGEGERRKRGKRDIEKEGGGRGEREGRREEINYNVSDANSQHTRVLPTLTHLSWSGSSLIGLWGRERANRQT